MGNEKILIADDEKAIITIMTKLFERLGYKVTARTDPVEIFEIFKRILMPLICWLQIWQSPIFTRS